MVDNLGRDVGCLIYGMIGALVIMGITIFVLVTLTITGVL